MMFLAKLAATILIVLLVTCVFGLFYAGNQEAQAILKPMAVGGFSLLGLIGVAFVWRFFK